jgi:hypothetical protein
MLETAAFIKVHTTYDPNKADFYVEYKDNKGKWRRYTTDFVIRRKPGKGQKPCSGKVLIVEIKAERERAHSLGGARHLRCGSGKP